MRSDQEAARRAQVKRAFGGRLDDTERAALERYAATKAGQEFARSTQDVARVLRELGGPVPRPPDDLARRFVEARREEAREMHRRLVSFALGTFGIFSLGMLVPVVFPKPGMGAGDWLNLAILLTGGATLVVVAVGLRVRRMIHGDTLIDDMRRWEGRIPRAPWSHIRIWLLLAAVVALTAHSVWGWGRSMLALAALGGVLVFVRRVMMRRLRDRRMQHDPETWAWWYGEEGT